MSDTKSLLPRQVADAYVDGLIALDPVTGTYLGVRESSSRLPDYSPPARPSWPSWRGRRSPRWTRPSACPARTVTPSAAADGCCGSG